MAQIMKNAGWFSRQNILAGCVFIDIFAVSLIVPLLPIRFKELGVNPVTIGMIGSVYSISQIFGGLTLGYVSDRLEDRRSVLLMSFAGAAFSYTMVGAATSISMLILSRIVVGAVKQTMTVSKALAAVWSDDKTRASSMGMISSAATAAWVTGSAVTGLVYQFNPIAPSILAVSLYVIDACVVYYCLPRAPRVYLEHENEDEDNLDVTLSPPPPHLSSNITSSSSTSPSSSTLSTVSPEISKPSKSVSFKESFSRAFGNRSVACFVGIKICYELIKRADHSMQDIWAMDRFGLKMHELGELHAFKSVFTILLQGKIAGVIVTKYGETTTFLFALCLAVYGCVVQYHVTDVMKFAILSVPVELASSVLAAIALESLMTHLVPKSELGSALAVLDVLHSTVGVFAPMIGGSILQYWGLLAVPLVTGSSLVVLVVFSFFSMPSNNQTDSADEKKKKEK